MKQVYHLIGKHDTTTMVQLTLSLSELKILHNACVDVLREFPEMLSYDEARKDLDAVIRDNEPIISSDELLD